MHILYSVLLGLFCTFLWNAPTEASFLRPANCTKISEAERQNKADIVAVGNIISTHCKAAKWGQIDCAHTIKILNVTKGNKLTQKVEFVKSYKFDYNVGPEDIKVLESENSNQAQTYTLKKTNFIYQEVPRFECARPALTIK